MPSLNPFGRGKIPYHRISADYTDRSSLNSATKEEVTDDSENDLLINQPVFRPRRSTKWHGCICYILVGVLSLIIGIVLGETFRLEYQIDGYLAPFGQTQRSVRDVIWQQNDTFAQDPSKHTEAAWASLIPQGRGFVQHPILATELKSVSVFHELHCLHGIRTAYFTTDYLHRKLKHEQALITHRPHHPRDADPDDHPHVKTPFAIIPYIEQQLKRPEHGHGLADGHIKHCFDYLRQALMCAADTNLEDVTIEDGEHGAPGWGTKRMCRDFDSVFEWAEKWRKGDGVGIV